MPNRSDMLRWIVVVAIWVIMLGSVILTIRASSMTAQSAQIARKAATIDDVMEYQGAVEFARAFAVEWATWNGNATDYVERMKVFNPAFKSEIIVPEGEVKRVVGSGVVGVKDVDGTYIVDVYLHTQRYSALDDNANVKEAYIVHDKKGWVDSSYTVRVGVDNVDGKYSASLPIIVNTDKSPVEKNMFTYNSEANENIKALATSFLKFYYSSTNPAEIANYITPDSKIKPVGGWEVAEVVNITVDSKIDPQIAQVQLKVKQGSDVFQQVVYLGLVNKNGQYFINKITPF